MVALVYIAACRIANLDGRSFVKETLHVRHCEGKRKHVFFFWLLKPTRNTNFIQQKSVFFHKLDLLEKTLYLQKTMMSPLTVFEKPQAHFFSAISTRMGPNLT